MQALGTEMVILTGGEPLLRPDIYDIARHASDQGLWVVMGTNGVLITDRVAQKMVECGVRGVGISIDSLDPVVHNRFRGGPNAWELSVRALEICRAHGLEVLIQTTVMEMNYDEIPRLIDFAREKGVWSFNLYGGCCCRAYAAYGDYLQEDPACTYQPTGQPLERWPVQWSPEAWARLERIPIAFIREKVRQGLEAYAQRQGVRLITPDLMKEAMAGEGRPGPFFGKHL